MYPYWSYYTDKWPQAGRGGPDADAVVRGGGDQELAHRVAERILADPVIHGGQVEISVQNRVVILEGSIDSAARVAAGRQAWAAPGVHDVCNRLTVAA